MKIVGYIMGGDMIIINIPINTTKTIVLYKFEDFVTYARYMHNNEVYKV
jgi:hypothetical protein